MTVFSRNIRELCRLFALFVAAIGLLLAMLRPPAALAVPLPSRGFWNSHYSFQNVAELFNADSQPLSGTARLLDAFGNELGSAPFTIPAGGQRDLILNAIPGYVPDSIGMLSVETSGGSFFGRLLQYRFAADGSVEIVMGLPFQPPVTGTSYVNYNTFQPTHNPADAGNIVFQWLQIHNLHQSAAKSFAITIHDQLGPTVRYTTHVSVPPNSRVDLPAGHQLGDESVGLIDIVPDDAGSPYLAQLNRYSSDVRGPAVPSAFTFGISLPARTSTAIPVIAPISTGGGAENWAVIANVSDFDGGVRVRCASNSAGHIDDDFQSLPAHSQVHMLTNPELALGESGAMTITPTNGIQIIAESTEYFRHPVTGALTAGFSTVARVPSGTTNTGSYNTFLGQYNYVKLYNQSESPVLAVVKLRNADGFQLGSQNVTLPGLSGVDLGIHDLPFAPPANSFGQISVDLSADGAVMTEFMRIRMLNGFDPTTTIVDAGASFAGR